MKHLISLGAVLSVGIAAAVHPAFVSPGGPERRISQEWETANDRLRPAAHAPREVPRLSEAEPPVKRKGLETVTAPRKDADPTWRKITSRLSQELCLTPLQAGTVEQILRDRAEEIRRCHEEIRRARILDMRQYEWQVGKMKEFWYRRIDGVLDAKQHERFVALVQQGLFNEGLGFTEDPGMTVLE